MSQGILLCGLNGSGKSTLGKALAAALGCAFFDIEDYYFPDKSGSYAYQHPVTSGEVERRLLADMLATPRFVLASVRGDYADPIPAQFCAAVVLRVPKALRMARIKARSYQKFGDRMLPGGDLHEQEQRFFDFAASRCEQDVDGWLSTLACPVIPIDGTQPIPVSLEEIVRKLACTFPIKVL